MAKQSKRRAVWNCDEAKRITMGF